MDTIVQCAQCVLFLFILRISFVVSYYDENCIQFESGAPGPITNGTEIKENNYINLTARLQDTPQCKTNNHSILHIKISYQQINKTVDVCKFILKTTCEVSDSSYATSSCKCVNTHTVQFVKKASSSDSNLYTWKWRHSQTTEKHMDIFISVTKDTSSTESPSDTSLAATTSTVVCVLFLVVATTAGVVLWMRPKMKCSIEVKDCGGCYHPGISDPANDNQVDDQVLSHAADTCYTAVKDHVNTRFSDTRPYYDPSYPEVKEEDTSLLLESSCFKIIAEQTLYASVKKQPRDTTDTRVKGQNSQPINPHCVEVEKPTNDQKHDDSQHYHLKNVDIDKHDTCQQLHSSHSDINEQHSSQNYDPNSVDIKQQDTGQPTKPSCYEIGKGKKSDEPLYAYVEKEDKSQPLDPTNSDDKRQHSSHHCDPRHADLKTEEKNKAYLYAQVENQTKRNPGSSIKLHIKKHTNYPDDLVHSAVKQQDENIAVDPPQVTGQNYRQGSDPTYSLINKHNPAQPVNPIHVPDKEERQQQDNDIYNHLHEYICQHEDPNYTQVQKQATRQVGGLTFQDAREDKNLKRKRTQASQTNSSPTYDNQLTSPPPVLFLSL